MYKTTEDQLLAHLTYALDDIFAEVNHGNTELALDMLKELQHVVQTVKTERAALEAQMYEFYHSDDSHLDDEEMPS